MVHPEINVNVFYVLKMYVNLNITFCYVVHCTKNWEQNIISITRDQIWICLLIIIMSNYTASLVNDISKFLHEAFRLRERQINIVAAS